MRSSSRRRRRADGSHRVVDRDVTRLDRARLLLQRDARARPQQLRIVEPRGRLGDPLHELADVARAREHPREALGRTRRVAQHPQEPRRAAEPLADAPEGEQPVVGIDAVGEPPDHDRHEVPLDRRPAAQPAGERRDVPQRARRVGEADRREPVVRLRGREGALLLGQGGDRRQQRTIEEPHVDVAHFALDASPTSARPSRRSRRCRIARASTRRSSGREGIRCVRRRLRSCTRCSSRRSTR